MTRSTRRGLVAREYREGLRQRLCDSGGEVLGGQLAVLIDGAYTSAVHLGPAGPAATGLSLAHHLIDTGLEARSRNEGPADQR